MDDLFINIHPTADWRVCLRRCTDGSTRAGIHHHVSAVLYTADGLSAILWHGRRRRTVRVFLSLYGFTWTTFHWTIDARSISLLRSVCRLVDERLVVLSFSGSEIEAQHYPSPSSYPPSNPSLEAQIPALRPKSQSEGPNPRLEAQIQASRPKS